MIAILYICTGKYSIFWENFYLTCEKNFISNESKTYFVFTDATEIYGEANISVVKIFQKNLGWPDNTLFRFKMFKSISNRLVDFDYIFFFNANIVFCEKINYDFLPVTEKLLGVIHPSFFNNDRKNFTYENNKFSTAYISEDEGKHYFMGGINGGKSEEYLKLIYELDYNIKIDYELGIIAEWHDESHLNKYYLTRNIKILYPDYGYPEGWNIPFKKKIMILDKNKFGGHSYLRNQSSSIFIRRLKKLFFFLKK